MWFYLPKIDSMPEIFSCNFEGSPCKGNWNVFSSGISFEISRDHSGGKYRLWKGHRLLAFHLKALNMPHCSVLMDLITNSNIRNILKEKDSYAEKRNQCTEQENNLMLWLYFLIWLDFKENRPLFILLLCLLLCISTYGMKKKPKGLCFCRRPIWFVWNIETVELCC